ncbi:hypothetical protein AMTRI_Chr10g6980 [Amborella trichopoda]|uniref:NB-ARC domain-containing protein n=1 Tax=Amborella trichopoda TaxID=13333 RepID=W1P7D3_AMBTC|nr:hypothetical protein AMTR_s00006p00254950 [Amborella trichopoda]
MRFKRSVTDFIKSQRECQVDRRHQIATTLSTYSLGCGQEEGTSHERQMLREKSRTLGLGGEDDVVGIEKDVVALLRLFLKEEERCCAVLVVGNRMRDLCQTTLVKKVYNNAGLMGQFDYCVWVYVSQNLFNKKSPSQDD